MNYLEWELERQREALMALLLGGGTEEELSRRREAEDAEPVGDGDGLLRRERARAGEGRRDGPEALSAWEGVVSAQLGREETGRVNFPGPAGLYEAGERVDLPDGGTGVREMAGEITREMAGGEAFRWAVRRVPEGAGSGGALPAGTPPAEAEYETWRNSGAQEDGEGAARGRASSERSGGETAGGGFPAQSRTADGTRWIGGSEWPEASGLPVLQETAEGGGTAGEWAGGHDPAGTRAEDGARALSRAVQRDARRYDGGFTIY